jgi:acetyl-CoA carboxylase biotin carboxyl carrier protein
MNIEEIKQLAKIIIEIGITEIEIEEKGRRLRLTKQPLNPSITTSAPSSFATITTSTEIPNIAPAPTSIHSSVSDISAISSTKSFGQYQDCRTINSPMIGTFYRSASPENDPLVKVGDTVKANMPVCILETMKVMNEILSDVEGTIIAIPVENGESVEFDQILFYIKPTTEASGLHD